MADMYKMHVCHIKRWGKKIKTEIFALLFRKKWGLQHSTLFCKNWSCRYFWRHNQKCNIFSLYFTKLFCLYLTLFYLIFWYMTDDGSHLPCIFHKRFPLKLFKKTQSTCTLQDSTLCPHLDYLVHVQENWQWLIRVGIQCIDGRHSRR